MPLLQIGCSAADLDTAQWQLVQLVEQLQAGDASLAGNEWLRNLVAALPNCATPSAWMLAFLTRLSADLGALLDEKVAALNKLRATETRWKLYQERCANCLERQQAAEVEQWQTAYAALAQELQQIQGNLEQTTAALAHERQAHAATRSRLEAQVAAQNALIVKLREEMKARA